LIDGTEWPATLSVPDLRRGGWRPVPFRQFVVKLHSRCDLACDYCYLYTMADHGWRDEPSVMSRAVVDQTCARVAEHVDTHELDRVQVILHGGEPLLAGSDVIEYLCVRMRRSLPSDTVLDVRIQTNGVRLDRELLETLARHRVGIGISLDGDAAANDRHRRNARGRGSFAAVDAALRLVLAHHPELFTGLLCTVDLANDPVATYEALLRYAPPAVDLLLPHGNWSSPPRGRPPSGTATPYGDWLSAVFDRWYGATRRETDIRYFSEIMCLLLGGASRVESIGLSPVALIVIATGGTIEQVDTLRSAYHSASGTGLNVFADTFDAALNHPAVAARQVGTLALADSCLRCPEQRVCGGGYYPHRYRAGSGFRQPSVYCPDLLRLIRHIRQRMRADLPGFADVPC
jgi:uncharacterized protein